MTLALLLSVVVSALGITLAEFFAEDEKQVDPMERQLVSTFQKLGDAHKLTLLSTADALLLAEKSMEDVKAPEEEE